MEPEVGHGETKFAREFTLEAVRPDQGARRVLCAGRTSLSSQSEKSSTANEAMCEVARIAGVPKANQTAFVRLLGSAIKRAHIESARPSTKNVSAGELIRDFFDPIVRASKKLRVERPASIPRSRSGRSRTASSGLVLPIPC
jgi:hypothetical protein